MEEHDRRARPGLNTWHEDEAHERFGRLCAEVRRLDIERARCLAAIARSKHYRFLGCASLSEYGRNQGLRPCETWDRARVGMLLEGRPELEEKLLSGEISFEAGASLHDVVTLEGEDAETWIARALEESTPVFTARVEERLHERRLGSQPVRMSVLLSSNGKEVFEEARGILEQREGRNLTEGEVIETTCGEFVDREAPKQKSTRRRPPVPQVRVTRHLPVWVRDLVRKRDKGTCVVPGCGCTRNLHYSHITAFRHGGAPTPENIVLLCPLHNYMMESGFLRIEGDANAPRFLSAGGEPYRHKPGRDPPT